MAFESLSSAGSACVSLCRLRLVATQLWPAANLLPLYPELLGRSATAGSQKMQSVQMEAYAFEWVGLSLC